MKTENTCVNCALLECHVRRDCEDNELPIEPQEPVTEDEDTNVTVQVVFSKPTEKITDEKRFW